VEVYPNPVSCSSAFNVYLNSFTGNTSNLEVRNMNGQLLLKKKILPGTSSIDAGNKLRTGIYVLSVDNGVIYKKIKLVVK
jgi:hypothetical protein